MTIHYSGQMDTKAEPLENGIASRLRVEREARNWSLAVLAEKSTVSKAMISKIERSESSPTTAVLGRLCAAFGLTLSSFLTRAEGQGGTLSRAASQPSWRDPENGMVRRLISPTAGGAVEIVSIDLPAGAEISFPAAMYASFQQTVWVQGGELRIAEGAVQNHLKPGDCLELGPPSTVTFRNEGLTPCQYIVAATKRDGS